MWVQINEDYLSYLREHGDTRVPNQDYGAHKFNPFFPVFKLKNTGIVYVANVGHYKATERMMEDTIDFKKIAGSHNNYIGVVHLNMMFPVPKDQIKKYDYTMIEEKMSWGSSFDFKRHLPRFQQYEKRVKEKDIALSAMTIYEIKNKNLDPYTARRTLPFLNLEAKLVEYQINKYIKNEPLQSEKIEVEREGNDFLVNHKNNVFKVTYNEIEDVEKLYEYVSLGKAPDLDMEL